ncbi:MAG TPA: TetR/AcrR family transcriptional regulator [Egicoccus sp.]|nr:TetR/AcrR family transcriptional regulator [Egicoccus sp.]HSK24068.1 TetR/AcrR family transcriptional regulator [Egicoccus sp.]
MTADEHEGTMPPGLRRLWGSDDRSSRPGQKPSLDIRQVARAAIGLADEGGLEAVSMSRVAAALGVTTMALYRYVENKADLLELMLEVAAGDPPPLDPALEWRDAITAWSSNLAAVYRPRPWVLQIAMPGPPRGPHQLAWAEQGMDALASTALPAEERLECVLALLVYVRGQASLEQQLAAGFDGDEGEAYAALIGGLDSARFPHLTGLFAAPSTEAVPSPADDTGVGFGLERLLDGIELLVRRRARQARSA